MGGGGVEKKMKMGQHLTKDGTNLMAEDRIWGELCTLHNVSMSIAKNVSIIVDIANRYNFSSGEIAIQNDVGYLL